MGKLKMVGLLIEETLVASGYSASPLRNSLMGRDGAAHLQWAQHMMNAYQHSGHVEAFSAEHLFDRTRPMILRTRWMVRNGCRQEAEQLTVMPSSLWVEYFCDVQASALRTKPMKLEYPFALDATVTVRADMAGDLSPAWTRRNGAAASSRWDATRGFVDGACRTHLDYYVDPGVYDPVEYGRYHDAARGAVGALLAPVPVGVKEVPRSVTGASASEPARQMASET